MISSPIDEIKNRLDIVEVIQNYIKLQKVGANYRALCPFHSEKKPSFFISPARQIWHCFGGCSEGGDIFKFVMKIEGVEFGDALRILAQKAGVELRPVSPQLKTERQRLYEISEWACCFFEKQLDASLVGKEAKKYLLSRGIKEESIKKWRIGYSPDTWQGLSDFLLTKGYERKEISRAGLATKTEKGNQLGDRFRGRIIFPIFDLNSQVIGFGGRVFGKKGEKEIAKYLNTPNTLIYDKSRVLYGLNNAKVAMRKQNQCILVEGYIDLIMVFQSGYENVAATSGTSLTPFQLKILKRYSDNLLTAFDMDAPGSQATKRGVDLAQAQGFNIKVVTMSKDSDPADIISKNPKEWEKLVKNAKSIVEFYFEIAFSRFDSKTPEEKKEISKIVLPAIKRIPNKIEQSHWTQNLAKKLEVKEESIEEELKKVKLEGFSDAYGLDPEELGQLPPKSRKELLEERLVVLLLISKSSENLKLITEKELVNFFPKMKEILAFVKKNLTQGLKFDVKELSSDLASFFNYLYLKSEIEEIEEKDIVPEIQCCLREINSLEIKNKLDKISQEIKKSENEKDSKRINVLIEKFNKLAGKLNNL
ncbi:DNA primase [Patescibacteria group bacterium]